MKLTNFDQECLALLEKCPDRFSKHCFRSAINHLNRAEKLFDIDSSMAVFRCITAEEEAATGLIYCLKECNYANADYLKPKNHIHKGAVIPYFGILCQFIEDSFRQYGIEIDLCLKDVNGHIQLKLEVLMALNNSLTQFIPEPPLNFAFAYEGKRFSYKKQIDSLVKSKGGVEIRKYLQDQANQRNLLLYATPKGFPSEIQIPSKFLPAYQKRVIAMLRAYLLTQPYKEIQPFVQDSLDAFLAMIASLELNNLHDDV